MTISIVGCGWLGLPLGQFLVEKGFHVKGTTTTPSKLKTLENSGIEPFLLDLNHPESFISTLLFETDLLYINIPPGRRVPNIERAYPKQIDFLIKKVVENRISNVIFVSSTGVYPDTGGKVDETTTTAPTRSSTLAITTVEEALMSRTEFKTTILRPAGLVGGNRKAGRFFAGKKNIPNGQHPVNLVHLDDCIGVSYAVLQQHRYGEIFNICADEHPSKALLYPIQAVKHGFEPPSFMDESDDKFKIIDNQKSKTVLGYEYKYPNPLEF